jgi:hypothetical protein
MHGIPAFICGGAVDFAFAGLYLPIRCSGRCSGCYCTEVIGRRDSFSLLSAALSMSLLLAGCGQSEGTKPDLPQSVSPGWKLTRFDKAAVPAGIPADGAPQCWKAEYAGEGSADVFTCWYKERGSAFEAVQRARTEAQSVKVQEGQYLVLVRWNGSPKANVAALVRAVEKATAPR